jgi:two-component system NarL family sensor kinase
VIILLNKGWAYLGLGQYANASVVLKQAESEAQRVAPGLLPDAYDALSRLSKKKQNYQEALEYFELKTETENKMFGKATVQKVEQLERDFINAKKEHESTKKELLISRQSEIIRRKNLQTYGILSGSIVLGLIAFILFKNQQRIQKQKSEIIAWKSMVSGEENERARIAHELHDNICGSLSTAKVWLSALQQRPDRSAEERDYEEVLALLDHTLQELRSTAHNLMPELLLSHGLAEAVRLFCNNIQRTGLFKIEYQYIGYIGALDKKLELMIYRILQELIHNIVKHAHPTFVLVQLSCHGDILSATIEDNGCGMDMNKLKYAQGMGLQNIRRSINHLKGQFSFRSEPGSGTAVYFEIATKNNSSI